MMVVGITLIGVPFIAFAVQNISEVFAIFLGVFDTLVALIVGFSLIVFIWGVAKYILNAANPEARSEGRQFMLWGIVALFVVVSVWGLVQVLQETFDVRSTRSGLQVKVI